MSKDEEKNFKKCKTDEKRELKPRYKSRPTACLKKTTQVNDHITDQDYNLLWQVVNQQIEETAGVDMKKELPISEFVELALENSSSNLSSLSNSVTISSIFSSILSSSSTSLSINSSSVIDSVLSSASSQKLQSPQNNSISISFLDALFGSVKAGATTNDGWR